MAPAGVHALLDLLRAADSAPATHRPVISAFIDVEGPQVLHVLESSMHGDWRTDAKNGTLTCISAIARLLHWCTCRRSDDCEPAASSSPSGSGQSACSQI